MRARLRPRDVATLELPPPPAPPALAGLCAALPVRRVRPRALHRHPPAPLRSEPPPTRLDPTRPDPRRDLLFTFGGGEGRISISIP